MAIRSSIKHLLYENRLTGAGAFDSRKAGKPLQSLCRSETDWRQYGAGVAATVADLFDSARNAFTPDTPKLKQKVVIRPNPHIMYIGLTYNFGHSTKRKDVKLEYDENLWRGRASPIVASFLLLCNTIKHLLNENLRSSRQLFLIFVDRQAEETPSDTTALTMRKDGKAPPRND